MLGIVAIHRNTRFLKGVLMAWYNMMFVKRLLISNKGAENIFFIL